MFCQKILNYLKKVIIIVVIFLESTLPDEMMLIIYVILSTVLSNGYKLSGFFKVTVG